MGTSHFEKEYYENPDFWVDDRYGDEETAKTRAVMKWIPDHTKTILDIGCGNGWFANYANKTYSLVGMDRSRAALRHVQTACCLADAGDLPFSNESFDLVVSMEMLEHLPFESYLRTIHEIARVVRKYVLITVPYKEQLNLKLAVCPECGCKFHRWYHMRSFSKSDMQHLFFNQPLVMKNLRLEGVLPVKQVPLLSTALRWYNWRFNHRFPSLSTCPLCGFRKHKAETAPIVDGASTKRISQYLKGIEAKLPFKSTTYRWWMGLYQKQ